ncbi:putative ribonuclease H-like domain-containing protein [Tanacetum coccineum]
MKAIKENAQLQKIVDSWKDSSKNLWKLVDFEEDFIDKPLYSRFSKTDSFKGVPHPLTGDYTPKPQQEIDESLYVYGKKGPQKPETSVSDDTFSENSVTTNEKVVSEPKPKEVEPSCKMAREAELKKQRVFNTGNGVAKPVWNNANRVNHANHFVPRPVQLKAVRQNVNSVRSNVNTGRANVNSVRQNVNSVRSNVNTGSFNVNTVRTKQPVPISNSNSFSPVRPQTQPEMAWVPKENNFSIFMWQGSSTQETYGDRGIFDSGCSGHMTGNKDHLDDFEECKGGSVTFGGSKGYITGKGRIRVGNLDFDSVSFVKELGHFNLFSISQICDKQHKVLFTETECLVVSPDFKMPDENQILLKVPRQHNMYSFDMKTPALTKDYACLIAKATSDESKLWHRRLGHINFKNLNKLVKGNLVRGLPSKVFRNDHTCVACQKGKQHKASCKAKLERTITEPLHTLHMDLFGPTSVKSINHASYCLVITDDCTRFSWVFFLATKDETSGILQNFIRQIENQLNHRVKIIRSDNGTEFKNRDMLEFCGNKGIKQEYSNARTPQQNGVAERMNRTLIEAARTMLADSLLPTTFWAEAVSTACYIFNRVRVTKPQNKTPYELLFGHKELFSYIRTFWGAMLATILDTLSVLGKFDGKCDEGFLVGYSLNSKAFRVYNLVTKKVEVNLHVKFLEEKPNVKGVGYRWMFDIDYLTDSMNYIPVSLEKSKANPHAEVYCSKVDKAEVLLNSKAEEFLTELQNLKTQEKEAYSTGILEDTPEILAFRRELDELALKQLREVPTNKATSTTSVNSGGTKRFLNSSKDDSWVEAMQEELLQFRLQQEGLLRLSKLYMELQSSLRVGMLLYSTFLEKHGYRRGTIDKTLFIKKDKKDIMLVQVYVDDIIFGSTRKSWCDEFEALMKGRFQMSSMGELIFFLGLQVKQKTDGIFISQDKYVADEVDVHLYRSMIESLRLFNDNLKGKPNLGLWYPRESSFDLEAYSDSDYAGANLDRKSTTGGCQFLGSRLISWQCKKQTIVATSTTEAEYVAAASCYGQVLWIQNQMLDYGFNFMNTKIHIDNESTICIVKNLVYHSKTKHIEIRHHFIRDSYEKKLIRVEKIHTDFNVADLLTKAFDGPRFNFLVVNIGYTWIARRIGAWIKVKQFWQTATATTLADMTLELRATIDTLEYTITEASVRSKLQLADVSGISMLPNTEIFEGMEERTMTVDDLLQLVPKLITKVDSLKTKLKQTKLTMGKALVKLVEKRSKRWKIVPQKGDIVVLPDSEDEDAEISSKQGRNLQEEGLDEMVRNMMKDKSERSKLVDKGKRYKRRKESKGKDIDTGFEDISAGFEDVVVRGFGRTLAEEELTEQQKKRKAQVQFEAQFYTEEDSDAIRAKLEANAELTKDVMGKDLSEQDFAKRMELGSFSVEKLKFEEEYKKSLRVGICIYSDAWGLDELEETLEQIEPYDSRLPAIDDI